MKSIRYIALVLTFLCSSVFAEQKIIHLFVALCDNESQGIHPVGAKIGDGDKPEDNLYWGCSDGAQKIFGRSKLWTKIEEQKPQEANTSSPIMRRIIFQHKKTKTILIADAYQGKLIKQCMTDYLNSSSGAFSPDIECAKLKKTFKAGSESKLTAFIGHNGLMEHTVATTKTDYKPKLDTITLCCVSDSYFKPYFKDTGTTPILQTKSLMYPGAFILHDAIEGWLVSESKDKIRTRAAKAYAKNQKISVKGGYSIFTKLDSN